MHPLLKKLSRFATFDRDEAHAIEALFGTPFVVEPRTDLVRETDPTNSVVFLLEGMACRNKVLQDGGRQILGLVMPGDCCDPGVSALEQRDHAVSTLCSSATLVRVHDAALEHALIGSRKLRHAFNWAGLTEGAISREWIANVGHRSALERIAHLFCEIYHRLDAIGLAHDRNFRLPMTQTDLGEAIGTSAVHVNRTLQELRARNLIAFGDKLVTILDFAALEALAGFDPTYLHLSACYREPGAFDGSGENREADPILFAPPRVGAARRSARM
jgi:CRP-like cAMP-binding protein